MDMYVHMERTDDAHPYEARIQLNDDIRRVLELKCCGYYVPHGGESRPQVLKVSLEGEQSELLVVGDPLGDAVGVLPTHPDGARSFWSDDGFFTHRIRGTSWPARVLRFRLSGGENLVDCHLWFKVLVDHA